MPTTCENLDTAITTATGILAQCTSPTQTANAIGNVLQVFSDYVCENLPDNVCVVALATLDPDDFPEASPDDPVCFGYDTLGHYWVTMNTGSGHEWHKVDLQFRGLGAIVNNSDAINYDVEIGRTSETAGGFRYYASVEKKGWRPIDYVPLEAMFQFNFFGGNWVYNLAYDTGLGLNSQYTGSIDGLPDGFYVFEAEQLMRFESSASSTFADLAVQKNGVDIDSHRMELDVTGGGATEHDMYPVRTACQDDISDTDDITVVASFGSGSTYASSRRYGWLKIKRIKNTGQEQGLLPIL